MEKTKEEIVDELAQSKGSDCLPSFLRDATLGMIENLVYDAMDIYGQQIKSHNPGQPVTDTLALRRRISELENKLTSILYMSEDRGVDGCTWGDTEMSSTDVVYGYNLALENVKEGIESLLNKGKLVCK